MWYTPWLDAIRDALPRVAALLPTVIGALLLAGLGWLLAKLLARWARSATTRLLSRLEGTSALGNAIEASGTRAFAPVLVGLLVFWVVMLVFMAAAVEIVGLPVVTDLIGRLAVYVPNLVAAAAVLLAGLVLARLARSTISRAAERANVAHGAVIASVVNGVIVVIAAVVAIEQLGIDGRVLELTIAVTVGSALAAVALAFGFGARGAVANLIAARYASQVCRVGQKIRVDGVEGTVVEIGPSSVGVESGDSRAVVPAVRFHETTVVVLTEES